MPTQLASTMLKRNQQERQEIQTIWSLIKICLFLISCKEGSGKIPLQLPVYPVHTPRSTPGRCERKRRQQRPGYVPETGSRTEPQHSMFSTSLFKTHHCTPLEQPSTTVMSSNSQHPSPNTQSARKLTLHRFCLPKHTHTHPVGEAILKRGPSVT